MSWRELRSGALAGIAGGVVFGMMMAMMGMLTTIGKMVGHPSALVGFGVHMVISAGIGASFSVVSGRRVHGSRSGLVLGALYGLLWWFLGPLTLMPFILGMGLGTSWNAAAAAQMLPSLMGHVVYGTVLGIGYGWQQGRRSPARDTTRVTPIPSSVHRGSNGG
jgi:hypothetical protein